jgi:inosose dehydratase
VRHVHAKDVRAEVAERAARDGWSFLQSVLEGVFTVPGDGCLPFDRVFRELRSYSGWIVLEAEQDPAKADPVRYATLGLRNLRRLVAEDLT